MCLASNKYVSSLKVAVGNGKHLVCCIHNQQDNQKPEKELACSQKELDATQA